MPENKLISIALLVILIINTSNAQTSPGEGDVVLKWRYSADNVINTLTAGKINDTPAVLVASSNTLHILDKKGNLVGQYTVETPGAIHAIKVGDIDGDKSDEILLGVGWMETGDINLTKIYTSLNGTPEDVDLLYRTTRSTGSLYVIDEGKINKWGEVDQWVRSIFVSDINGDGEEEVIVVSGGYFNNYFKRYTDVIYTHRYCWTEWDIKHTGYTELECTCQDCSWDNESEECHQNVTWQECGWNETIDKGWNFTESSSVNASILIFDKTGKLLLRSNISGINGTFQSAALSNLYHDSDEEIIVGLGNEIRIITSEGGLHASYNVLNDVKNIYTSDVNNDENDDIIFSFRNQSSDRYGVEVINKRGEELWTYQMKTGSIISAMYMKTLREHGINEIMPISDNILYVIDDTGQLDWNYQFKQEGLIIKNINNILILDVDGNGYEDILIASNRVVYDYELVGTFIKKQSADRYYSLGGDAYELNKYNEALSYLERARQLYLESDYNMGVLSCDSMLREIKKKLQGSKKTEADSKYAKALTYYSTSDYTSAKKSLEDAREIYEEINDQDGILRCDKLMDTINKILIKENTTTSTTTTISLTTTTTLPREFNINSIISNPTAIIGTLGIILTITIILRKHKTSTHKEEKKEKETKEEKKEEEKERKEEKKVEREGKRIEGIEEIERELEEIGEMGEEEGKEGEEDLKGKWKTLEDEWKKLDEP